MALGWIKMRADLFTHPKVVRIASAHRADTLRVVGGLMSVWCLFDAHSEDGRLDGYTPQTLDTHLRWDGFAESMISVGWLEFDGESLVTPRFDAHNGHSAKRRAQESERKREVRKTSAFGADKLRTREEKRREDISPTEVGDKRTRKRAASTPPVARPEDVADQTWADWLELRRQKRAAVTETVVAGAIEEAGKAGMSLDAFLRIWCRRGSQGLEAAWLKPDEKRQSGPQAGETFYERDQRAKRERWEAMTGRKWPTDASGSPVIDVSTIERIGHESAA